ncbi:MAG: (d)CMP kinase [Cetobacterium sp.]|uniref:Cytidylate kinase n=1 Tax=Cetobacterium ceti TaxID=180163 RepID=A0A1T4JSN4_9FUSO|nr:(d)CMP kinase [Cetobacterium ceti]MCJ8341834.1 (d)CMP kinase [Cetobacterium sp.]SJZ33125.1 cytidylate kinase [Cetobacterium ceti]
MENFVVAIDGPAGSGKSTIAKIIGKDYGLTYLDTGAMYRMVALYTLKNNISLENKEEIVNALEKIEIDIQGEKFILNGEDVSKEIRTPEVASIVSPVAAIKEVRVKLVELQREISSGKKVILDGRDIGTVVFPKADLKIFLVASPEERAKRRMKDYESKNIKENFEEVLASIKERDHIDSTRKESPLKKAEDAIEIDTSFLNISEVVDKISSLINNRIGR